MVKLCMPDRVLNLAMMNFPPCWGVGGGVGGLEHYRKVFSN